MAIGSVGSLPVTAAADETLQAESAAVGEASEENGAAEGTEETQNTVSEDTGTEDEIQNTASDTEGEEADVTASDTEGEKTDGISPDESGQESVSEPVQNPEIISAPEETENSGTGEVLTEEKAFNSTESVALDDDGTLFYVHLKAEEGALPEDAVFRVKKAELSDDEKKEALEAADSLKDKGELAAVSELLDITLYDAEGQEIEPDGNVSISIGLTNGDKLLTKATEAVRSVLSSRIEALVRASLPEADGQEIKDLVREAVAEYEPNLTLDDISLKLYHITTDDNGIKKAEKLVMTAEASDETMPEAAKIAVGTTDSFSPYLTEAVLSPSLEETAASYAAMITETLTPPAAANEGPFSYVIKGGNRVSISTLVSDLQKQGYLKDVVIISGSSSDASVTAEGSGTARTFTVPSGGKVCQVVLLDAYGTAYPVSLYSDLPAVTRKESPSFTLRWNDNGGDDGSSPVKRPSWETIKNNYVIKYSVDGSDYKELDADSLSALGLKAVPSLEPDTTSSKVSWTFKLTDLPTAYTENTGNGQVTHTISYVIQQTKTPEGYLNDQGQIPMNGVIIDTVKTSYSASVQWIDNGNAYKTRPSLRAEDMLAAGTLKVMRYDSLSGKAAEAITVDASNISITEGEDGKTVISLKNLPGYCADAEDYGSPFVYSLLLDIKAADTADEGDVYEAVYENVDNYGSHTDALYQGGTLQEKLSNTVDFTYSKAWDDFDNEDRPDCRLYFYVAVEDEAAEYSFNPNTASAVDGVSTIAVPKENEDNITAVENLPKYNDLGQRLVYFAIEKGLTGDYVSAVNNAGARASSDVISVFDNIRGSYPDRTNGGYFPKYLLNGGTIDNKLSGQVTASVTKTINTRALQEMNGAEVTFILQKMVKETADDGTVTYVWADATKGDLVGYPSDENGTVELTLNEFRAESLTQTGTSEALKKYAPDGETVIYRWKEKTVSINGSDAVELTWKEEAVSPDKMTDETKEAVSIGKYVSGVDGEMVDGYVTGTMETTVDGSGNSLTTVFNDINAPYLLKIIKTWYVNGVNVTDKLSGTAKAVFEVLDENGDAVTDENGENLRITLNSSDLTEDGSRWEELYMKLPRFDENGYEHSYSVREISFSDNGYLKAQGIDGNWHRETRALEKVDAVGDAGVTAKERQTLVTNYYVEPGNEIYLGAQKEWKNDGDLISRMPVTVGIYYVTDKTFGLVKTLTLSENNVWTEKTSVKAGDVYYQYDNGKWTAAGTLPASIVYGDFVLVELGMGETETATADDGAGLVVPSNEATMMSLALSDETESTEGGNYLTWTADELRKVRNAISSESQKVGELASDEQDPDGVSNYSYYAKERTGYIDTIEINGYIFTNVRHARQNLVLTKTWQDGGEYKTGHFVLYRNGEAEFEFELGSDSEDEEGTLEDPDLGGASYHIVKTLKADGAANPVIDNVAITISGLEKYDADGKQYTYELRETAIKGKNGWVEIKNGGAVVDDLNYHASIGLDTSKGSGGVVYSELHHNGDVYYWRSSNSVSGSYPLTFYKVWYDEAVAKDRPNVYFDIYRVSSATYMENYTVKDWLEDPEAWKNGSSSYADRDFSSQAEAMGYLISRYFEHGFQAEKFLTVDADRYYDASQNRYLWKIDVGSVPQYDADGYPYVYLAVERNISTSSPYYGNAFYGNMTSSELSVSYDGTSPETTYDIYASDSLYSAYAGDTILILSDGIHEGSTGAGDYYSRTIVNAREKDRTVSGRKIWNTDPFTVSEDDMPTIYMALYRSTTPMATEDLDVHTNKEVDSWISETGASEVCRFALHTDTADDFNFEGYGFSVKYEDMSPQDGIPDTRKDYDSSGREIETTAALPKYDKYGRLYYYHVRELGDKDGVRYVGYDDAVYNSANLTLTNNYNVENQPSVEVYAGKEWKISAKALEQNPSLKLKDLAPVDLTLYAVMQDDDGKAVGNPIAMQTITLDPSEIPGADESTEGASYAWFKTYEANKSVIPYYAPNGNPFRFFIKESAVSGYSVSLTCGGKTVTSPNQDDEEKRVYLTLSRRSDGVFSNWDEASSGSAGEEAFFTNTYTGDLTSFSPSKKWADAYVDNSNYRPAQIRFKIERTSAYYPKGDGWSDYVYLKKTTVNKNLSTWTVNNAGGEALTDLLKYDARGNAYTYRITEECFLNAADQVLGYAYKTGDVAALYQYASGNKVSVTNRLNKSTAINLRKNWVYQLTGSDTEENFTYEIFDSLRSMNALPLTVKFVVEQKDALGSQWRYVGASDESSDHKVTVDGRSVVGYEININDITEDNFSSLFNISVSWANLPSTDPNAEIEYDYRVSEILTWQKDDGSTEEKKYENSTSYRGLTSTISSDSVTTQDAENTHVVTTYTIEAKNVLQAKKVRLAKEWVDNGGRDNTRPGSLVMTIRSANGEKSYTLATSKNTVYDPSDPEASVYYSDYFYIPGYLDVSAFNSVFTLKEKMVGTQKSEEKTLPAEGTVTISTENGEYEAEVSWPTAPEADGTYVIKAVNTLKTKRKTIEIHADKAWQENEEWEKTLRPDMTFTLQYLKQGGNAASEADWCDMGWYGDSWIGMFTVIPDWDPYYRAEPSISHVGSVSGGVSQTANWYYLIKYWDTPGKDGQAEPIQYRVRESYTSLSAHPNVTISSYAPVKNPVTFVNTKTQDPTKQTITNKIQYRQVQLIKNWTDQDGKPISLNDVDRLVDLKALPKAIRFEVSYNGSVVKTCDFDVKNLSYGLNTQISLPRYNAYGEEITYTIREAKISYDGTTWQDPGIGISLEEGSKSFKMQDTTLQLTFTNTLTTTEKSVIKAFKDEADRDRLQGSVVVRLYRDGTLYDTVTLTGTSDPAWEHTWSLLPKYQNSVNELSVYRIEEVSVKGKALAQSGYTVSPASPYTYGENDSITLTNTHNPYRGTITGKKVWRDIDDYGTKDSSVVYLALQYKLQGSSDWSFVKDNVTLKDGQYQGTDIPAAYTTSPLLQKADGGSLEAVWENVPVNHNGNKITYRVVEIETDEEGKPAFDADGSPLVKDMKGYRETFASASFEKGNADNQSLSLAVTNELITQTVSVTKNWQGDGTYKALTRPANIVIEISWKHGTESGSGVYVDGTWQNQIVLNDGNGWTCDKISLPLYDSEDNAYHYTVTEKYQFTEDSEPIEKSGYTMAMTMSDSSSWELQTTDKENVWKLELKSGMTAPDAGTLALTATNTLKTGSLSITKAWEDDDNREAKRRAVTVQLYRDGEGFGSAVTLDEAHNWTYRWENLPVYRTNGERSYYTVEETNVSGWTAIYPDGVEFDSDAGHGIQLTEKGNVYCTITNRVTPNYFNVTAQKAFDDADDAYGVSATAIWVQLLYSTDEGDEKTWHNVETSPEEADGTKVYTQSDLKQKITITKDASGRRQSSQAVWNKLPEKVRLTDASGQEISKTVYYKVVECTGPSGEASTDSKAFYVQSSDSKSYGDRDTETNTAALTLTNTLPRGNLKVEKIWDDVETGERPAVSVKLYRLENGTKNEIGTKALTQDADNPNLWTCTWQDLPLKDTEGQMISYVIEEISVSGYRVTYSGNALDWTDKPENVSLTADGTTTTYIKNTQITGEIRVSKAWQDTGFADERPKTVTYKLYRNNVLYKSQEVSVETNGSAAWTFDKLPVYDKEGKAFTYRIEEEAVIGYKAAYTGNGVALEGEGHTAEVTVTNTLETAALKVSKNWLDENDRDGIRPAANADEGISLQLYRDGKAYRDAVTVYQEKADDANVWEYEWTALPLYKADRSGEKSVYYVVETTPEGYTVSYGRDEKSEASSQGTILTRDSAVSLTVTNRHVPDKSSLKAYKVWDDQSDRFGKRPESIYLTLMYRIDGSDEWQMVERKDAEKQEDGSLLYPDGGVYTTDTVIQKLSSAKEDGDAQTAVWDNLPLVYHDGTAVKKIYYKVFETDADGKDMTDTAENYRVTYSTEEGLSLEKHKTAEETITNKLMSTILKIDKIWEDDENWVTDVRPTKLTFLVEYSLDGESWQPLTQEGEQAVCVDGMAVLEPDESGSWPTLVITDLPLITRDGISYRYRVKEYSMEIDGETIRCQDAEQGEKAKAGAYDGITSLVQNEDETWSAQCTNGLELGSVSVTKTWQDGQDRDGLRAESLTFELHRRDTLNDLSEDTVLDTRTIEPEKDGTWPTITWDNLPVWSRDGADKALYYVVESADDNYSTSYQSEGSEAAAEAEEAAVNAGVDETPVITVTNTYQPKHFTIKASKIWDDRGNARGLRDREITFTLSYSLDKGASWQTVKKLDDVESLKPELDDGTGVTTTSKVSQTVSGVMTAGEWDGFEWENLPAFAVTESGKSVEVWYQVTEAISSNTGTYYTVKEGETLSFSKASDGVAKTSVTNTVKPEDKKPITPKTGDNSDYVTWILMMAGAFVSMICVGKTLYRRKREE